MAHANPKKIVLDPGNIQVSVAPESFGRYIALDFGIVGTLTDSGRGAALQRGQGADHDPHAGTLGGGIAASRFFVCD